MTTYSSRHAIGFPLTALGPRARATAMTGPFRARFVMDRLLVTSAPKVPYLQLPRRYFVELFTRLRGPRWPRRFGYKPFVDCNEAVVVHEIRVGDANDSPSLLAFPCSAMIFRPDNVRVRIDGAFPMGAAVAITFENLSEIPLTVGAVLLGSYPP